MVDALLCSDMESNRSYNYSCAADKTKNLIFSYDVVDESAMTRIVIDFSGNIQQLVVCQLEEMGSSHVRFLISVVHLAFAIVASTHLNVSVWKVLNQPLLQTRMWVPGLVVVRGHP